MKLPPNKWLRFRITLLLCLFSFLFLVVFARAYQLQVLQSNKLSALAEKQYQRIVPLVPKRGILYDRKREEMAISVEVDSAFAQPGKLLNPRQAADRIGPILGKKPEALLVKMKEDRPFVWLGRGITPGQRAGVEQLEIEGIDFLKETKRFYPQGEMGCHVIGFAGVDSKGLEGVELGYDEFIRGEPGYILISKDGRGRTINLENPASYHSEEGCEIVLTIDRNIQYVTEKELKKTVQSSAAKGGLAIVMNPRTGEVLALAIQPSFDPNRFSAFSPQVWKNRAVTDTFEPGSTFKAFLLASALEERAAGPGDVFFCENGAWGVGGRVIHDTHSYGWLSLGEIIKVSSNIGASKVGQKLGKEKLHRSLKNFGFGSRTGVDLPGEVPGFLSAARHWSDVGLANICFGQGISTTALQLTAAFAVFANGGTLMKPYTVKAVLDPQGGVLKENQPSPVRRVISPETARMVSSILKTVTEEGGTGRAASLSGYEAAGKTGTAQKALPEGRGYSDKRVASFVGFAPVENPQVVISVIIDEPVGISYGGVVAAPTFKRIAEQVLPYMGVYPKGVTYLAKAGPQNLRDDKDPGTNPPPATAKTVEVAEEPGVMPDFSGKPIRQVVQIARRLGLELKLEGSGVAISQSPAPGQILQGNARGVVRFQSPI
jgi:cell division protein FtsI (penicillin-binding protein 3)